MDRLYNNEAIISCVIQELLRYERMDVARLFLLVVLLMDDPIRNRIMKGYKNFTELAEKESSYERVLNRKYKEYLPILVNAIVILRHSRIVKYEGNELCLTNLGETVKDSIYNIDSERLKKIFEVIIPIFDIIKNVSTEKFYHKLKIEL